MTDEQFQRCVQGLDDNIIARLMISFFFKGGVQELGCEFTHKSFRDYLFAEQVERTSTERTSTECTAFLGHNVAGLAAPSQAFGLFRIVILTGSGGGSRISPPSHPDQERIR